MNTLEEFSLRCPNCDERVEIFVDSSVEQQVYVEDCPVCCRPMLLAVSCDELSGISVTASREDD
ncbi:MAG: CPXCG motif-containing cysteine-rich protein [Chromatiaceae bacterium]|nr:CPXCG motif-containing cysteine-rich protein [Gammaproteobacteria bacterium]MCP5445522.1 CPXCG motif-containing cysteine-rich protein [Chromatiaceae bacterium]